MPMGVVIGIDVGGSTTKIMGFKEENGEKKALPPLFVRANDPVTSVYGAFGKFTHENSFSLRDIDKAMMTGVGSTFVTKELYELPCRHVSEFDSIGLGAMYLSGLSECLAVSLGTGTAIVPLGDATKTVTSDALRTTTGLTLTQVLRDTMAANPTGCYFRVNVKLGAN
jgi:type II pantothenate kinase